MSAINTAILEVIVREGGTAPGTVPPPPPRPAPVPAYPTAQPSRPAPGREEMQRQILATPGAKKQGLTPDVLGKMPENAIADLHRQISAAFPVPEPAKTKPPAPVDDGFTTSMDKLKSQLEQAAKAVDRLEGKLADLTSTIGKVPTPSRQRSVEQEPEEKPRQRFYMPSPARPPEEPTSTYTVPRPAKPKKAKADDYTKQDFASDAIDYAVKKFVPPRFRPFARPSSELAVPRPVGRPVGMPPAPVDPVKIGMGAEAGSAASTLGRFAAAAGPAILAVVAIELATRTAVAGLGKLERGIDSTGKGLAQLAGGDATGALNSAFQTVTGVMDHLGPATRIFSAEVKVAAAGLRAVDAVAKSIVQRAGQIAPYSGDITGAMARAEIRDVKRDIDEAKKLGRDMARVTDADSRIEDAVQRAMLPMRQGLTKVTAAVEERIAGVVERLVPVVERIGEAVEWWWDHGPKQAAEAAEAAERAADAMIDNLASLVGLGRKDSDKAAGATMLDEFERITEQLKKGPNDPRLPKPKFVTGPFGVQIPVPKN